MSRGNTGVSPQPVGSGGEERPALLSDLAARAEAKAREADRLVRASLGRRGISPVAVASVGGRPATGDALDHCFAVPSRNPHRIGEALMALSCSLWARAEQVLPPHGEHQALSRQQTAAGRGPFVAEEAR